MTFHFNPDNLLSAIATALRNDATLQGSVYLGGTSQVYTSRLPTSATGRLLLVTTGGLQQIDSQWSGEVRVFCYAALLGNQQIDPRANAILDRCEELLSNGTVSVSGMTVQPMASLGTVPSFFDQESDKTKSRGVLRLRVTIGYNS